MDPVLTRMGSFLVFDPLNQLQISIELKEKQKFAEVTERLLGNNFAIYLDDELLSDPVVKMC